MRSTIFPKSRCGLTFRVGDVFDIRRIDVRQCKINHYFWCGEFRNPSEAADAIHWALDVEPGTVEDMRVDNRCTDILVAEQFLDGPDVGPGFEEMRRKGVTERVTGDSFVQVGLSCGGCQSAGEI